MYMQCEAVLLLNRDVWLLLNRCVVADSVNTLESSDFPTVYTFWPGTVQFI